MFQLITLIIHFCESCFALVAKLNKNEYVALSVIHKICEYLDCPIQEVVEFVKEDS
ncbi:XRE family transcriptional regulator [Bacillus aerophilus]|uniref:helix-turn-helix domain-containing protein n=1 Tax=Bacillus sp. FSL R5-0286 TaxID=2954620 RepID=UPI001DF15763|nr:XRE family transcriptional regulator [Bacillus aerophilus]MBX7014658.1 XRE family transcriptional regulator [Bacillus aerophilus]